MNSIKCIFCKIVLGEMPAFKLIETERSIAFLDIRPLSEGHALVVPKEHVKKIHQLSDESLHDLLPVVKRLAIAMDLENYNLLQVHIHLIPKPNSVEGLFLGFDTVNTVGQDVLQKVAEKIKERLN
ncbi:hypothetical protein PORY_001606 [Pneumocystis oryctolagi]|uniref:Uncharacterized protein n=1 Tax=Pneumocystis oryctolagi TaxID=42067 RepID=A0ACB7CBK1_9ASCO|nr:hypothetical protein PORY_001606 [Pneumocystis oryctolagi]